MAFIFSRYLSPFTIGEIMKVPACDKKVIEICRKLGLDVAILQMAARVNFRNNFELGPQVKRVYKIKSGAEIGDDTRLTKAFKPFGFEVFSLHNKPLYLYTYVDGRALDARARRDSLAGIETVINGPVPPVDLPAEPVPENRQAPPAAPIQWNPNDAIINKIADRVVEKLLNMSLRKIIGG